MLKIDWEMTKPSDLRKKYNAMESALKVIYTWATFHHGEALHPHHVAALCEKVLGRNEVKQHGQ